MVFLNGDVEMSILRKILHKAYYYRDIFLTESLKIKIETFKFDNTAKQILIMYRFHRHTIMQKMAVIDFETEHFNKISRYDQYRLIKFSILQTLINKWIKTDIALTRDHLLQHIEKELENELSF